MLEEKTQELMVNMQAVLPLIVTNALSALGAIVILLIGLWLSGKADQLVVRVLSRTPHFDPTLKSFFGSLARYLILTVTLLAVLSQFGIQTTSLVAVIGAASLAVGLALQGTLSNLAAGIMLLIFRPFRVGHKVQVGGSLGTVKELSLFWTELVTDDKVQIIVPNGGVWGQPLRNFSIYPAPPHAGEVRFRTAEGTELEPAIEKVRTIVEAHPRARRPRSERAARSQRRRKCARNRRRVLHRRGPDRGGEERSDQGVARRARYRARQASRTLSTAPQAGAVSIYATHRIIT